jgi:hypothetical protein
MAEGANRSAAPATYRVDADDIGAFLEALRKHTDKNRLQRLMRKGLAEKTKPFQHEFSAAIPLALPRRGGLGPLIESETKFSVVPRSGRWAGLWVRATAKASAKKKSRDLNNMLGRGIIRHPVFGGDWVERHSPPVQREKWPWVAQTAGTNPALITGVVRKLAPDMRLAALEVMESIARQITEETNR